MAEPVAPVKKKEDPIDYVRSNYGFLAGFLEIPELKGILIKAAKGEWSPAKLQGAVYGTKWWKKTAEVTRQWIALQSTDPATAKKTLDTSKTQIQAAAKAAGVTLTPKQVNDYALNVNKFGWTPQQVQNAIGDQFKYNPKAAQSGQAALVVDNLKQIAKQYLIPVSDATIQKWGRDVIGGEIDVESFIGYAKQQAKSRWPGLADAIDRGVTPEQYTNTYRETIAQTLEIDPDTVDLTSAKWSKVIDAADPKTGVRSAMSLSDAAVFARKQPEFSRTTQARQQGAELTSFLGELFGKVG